MVDIFEGMFGPIASHIGQVNHSKRIDTVEGVEHVGGTIEAILLDLFFRRAVLSSEQ